MAPTAATRALVCTLVAHILGSSTKYSPEWQANPMNEPSDWFPVTECLTTKTSLPDPDVDGT